MPSFFYRLLIGIVACVMLVAFAAYMVSTSRGVRSKYVDDLRASASKEGMPDPPTLAQLREAAKKNPDSAEAQAGLAKGLMRHGEYGPEAIEAFGAAIRLSPGDAELYLLRGKIHENTGHSDFAIPDYEQAASLNPKLAEAMIHRADIARYRGELDTAIPWYRQALAAEPDNALAHTNLGSALAQKGEYTQAIVEYEAALQSEPENGEVMYNIGAAYKSVGDTRNARHWFERACNLKLRHRRSCGEVRRLNASEP